jgi:hypothetical protein
MMQQSEIWKLHSTLVELEGDFFEMQQEASIELGEYTG